MSLYTGKNRLIRLENQIENIKGWSIRLENWIKNVKGQSTSSEEAPEYFGAKRRLSFRNENIRCDTLIESEPHSVLLLCTQVFAGFEMFTGLSRVH